jgi:hypothetical protein
MILLPILFLLSSIKDCSQPNSRATVTSMSAFPEIPVANQNVTVTVNYDLVGGQLTGGTATYDATLNYFPVYHETFDLCTQTSCPKQPGPNTEISNTLFPSGVSGKLINTINWADEAGNPVWCVETTWKV